MITTRQFQTLDELYEYYNERIYGKELPQCMINLNRKPHCLGYFVANLWKENAGRSDAQKVHEISLNPDYIMEKTIEWHSTLLHEMTHLWQKEYGTPSRKTYHNKEWAAKMESIGLMPSDTGKPGGKRTGQKMSDYVIPGGKFEKVYNRIVPEELEALRLKYLPTASLNKKKTDGGEDDGTDDGSGSVGTQTRTKYSCKCGNNVWGRRGLNIRCMDCEGEYNPCPSKGGCNTQVGCC